MKRLTPPTGPDRPSWASLLGAVPALYVFWDPVRDGALAVEWILTALAFFTLVGLLTLAALFWSRERTMRRVCLAMIVLGVAFALYRPSGVLFFVYVAGLAPLAVSGRVAGAAAIVAAAVALIGGTWWARWPHGVMPYVVAIEALLVGGAITLILRQQMNVRHALKVAERERIARDLHDILGHTLSVITLKAELAGRLVELDPKRAQAEIGDVETISRTALAEVREVISGYRGGDLRSELTRARAALETAGISLEERVAEVAVAPAAERVLALVLREAVTNVVRHATARTCHIGLDRQGSTLRLIVRDDGRGTRGDAPGHGMRGIEERVEALGGTAAWKNAGGTELTVLLPAPSPAASHSDER